MSSVNKVTLIGHVGKDPEIKTLQSGARLANLTLATAERWTDKQTGEKREKVEWHRITIFNERLVDLAEKYIRKGDKIYVEGMIETRKWQDQSGQDRYSTEIVLKTFKGEIVLLSNKRDGGDGQYLDKNAIGDYLKPVTIDLEQLAAAYGAVNAELERRSIAPVATSQGSSAPAAGELVDDEIPF